jgi:hypothetical protein
MEWITGVLAAQKRASIGCAAEGQVDTAAPSCKEILVIAYAAVHVVSYAALS